VVGYVQLVGKTISSNSVVHGALRNKNPLLCSQGALGRWLITRFTINEEPVPDFTTSAWASSFIWPTKLGGALTYAGHAARVKRINKVAGVSKDKITHGPRVFAARWADMVGLDDAVSHYTLQHSSRGPLSRHSLPQPGQPQLHSRLGRTASRVSFLAQHNTQWPP
jgi:hypothetical protein